MAEQPERRAAIIDIGSNSIRLVVFAGPARAPTPIFNEKLMIGLGAGLAANGAIDAKAYRRALAGLARFRLLVSEMNVGELRCVATAAVREASNGVAFLADASDVGLEIELLSGVQEARASGFGVISALPEADGIVADLGGGSLELVRVRNGQTAHHSSFPLGVLRLAALQTQLGRKFDAQIVRMLHDAGWPGEDGGLPLYLVGGSWRALARYDMIMARDPLPMVSGHGMAVDSIAQLSRSLRSTDLATLGKLPGLASARVSTLADAASLLVPLVRQLKSSRLVVSTSGLREGLLFEALDSSVRQQDPLIVAAEFEGARFARFAPHGRTLDRWIAPLFVDDTPAMARLRLACCLLSEVASTANPDFRAERAAEMALHGQWWGIDLDDRLVMAQALYSANGGQGAAVDAPRVSELQDRLDRATQWGLAIRLAQRLSGGTASVLRQTRLTRDATHLTLSFVCGNEPLAGEQVEKRLKALAEALNLKIA
jgi:exopolyphosphatase/guanosine-5'-triphosphate,3'-diphosphate pyrophosphatase